MTSTPTPPKMTRLHIEALDETMMYVPSDLDSTEIREIEEHLRAVVSGESVVVPRAEASAVYRFVLGTIGVPEIPLGESMPFETIARGWLTESTPASTPDGESK